MADYKSLGLESEKNDEEKHSNIDDTKEIEAEKAPSEPCNYENMPDETSNDQGDVPLALLPPDHPLLAKFQQSLKEFLICTRDQLINEIEEIKYSVKQKEQQREEQGAILYDRQQEIQRQNEQLEEFAQQIQENLQQRHHEEEAVSQLKAEYEEKAQLTKEQKTLYNKRMAELEHMQELENNIRKWTDDVENEVKNAKRVVSRDAQLQQQLSEEKKRSDLLFYHLDVEVKKSETELEMVQNEIKDMEEVLEVLNMSVSNANADLEALENEHKRLTQSWSEVIVAISLRDRILYQVKVETDKGKESIKLNTAGIEATQKQIKKELQVNEKLETFKKRLAEDFTTLKKDCKQQSDILAGLEKKLSDIPLLLEQTEKDLKEAKKEGTQLETEIKRLQWKVDKQNAKKYECEENILKLAQDHLITDKASEYRLKLLHTAQEQRRGMELNLAQTQNQLASTLLDMERLKGNNFRMSQENDKLSGELGDLEKKSDYFNAELKYLETQIDIKMKRMDKLMNQLDELVRSSEGSEISPTELKIKQLEKSIQTTEQQILEYQQFWIMLQNHFVNLTQKRSAQMNQIQITQKQLSIIKQKSLKVDQELEQSESSTRELNRDIQIYQSKLELLNAKMAKKRQQHESEESECEQEHAELLERLKDNEMHVLRLEEDINELQTETEQYKDIVLDKHRESLSWETKYKLIEETLRWRKEESSLDSELGTMRTEIHRMQIRHQQLKRAQEKLIGDLDHCVMHREQIFVSAAIKQNIDSKPTRVKQSSNTTQYKINDLRNKLKQIQNDITTLSDQQIIQAKREYQQIQDEIKDLRYEVEQEESQDNLIRTEIEQALLLKYQNLENIVRKQNRAKSYRRLNATTQPLKLPRNESAIQAQMQKQSEMNDQLLDIVQTLSTEHPEKQAFFARLLQVLKD
ncbi:coiled-coil domain-containing protein 40 [Lucilia sericata]|uniref:coiled-coil domain-containing protein 40 n=1 Tax=Lucilia sericata TaxID=13632 RepID=UPI0018A81F4D|nr:coiled-coil domain-containing protein 40 [Lucilia sericata]